MTITAIIALAAITGLSVVGVLIAEEPADEVFSTNAAIDGFGFHPLATKVEPMRNESLPCPVTHSLRTMSHRKGQ